MASHQSNGVDALTQRLGKTSPSSPQSHLMTTAFKRKTDSELDGISVKDSMHAPTSNGLPQKAAYIPPHMREKLQSGSSPSYNTRYAPSDRKDMLLTISN
jgi:hypothetical protein